VEATKTGALRVLVNGTMRASHALGVHVHRPLFAVIELLGMTTGVKVNASSEAAAAASVAPSVTVSAPPTTYGAPAASLASATVNGTTTTIASSSTSQLTSVGFHRGSAGPNVTISASDGRRVTRRGASGGCVVFGERILDRGSEGSVAFSVTILNVQPGSEEGLAIGVTTRNPAEVRLSPNTADELQSVWFIGCDGSTFNGKDWGLSDWLPSKLSVGDVLDVVITAGGELQLAVNGAAAASHPLGIPRGPAALYPVLDLLGCTTGAALSYILRPNSGGVATTQPPKAPKQKKKATS
jgi:hypothetical protein